jgi:hypothetical protein
MVVWILLAVRLSLLIKRGQDQQPPRLSANAGHSQDQEGLTRNFEGTRALKTLKAN